MIKGNKKYGEQIAYLELDWSRINIDSFNFDDLIIERAMILFRKCFKKYDLEEYPNYKDNTPTFFIEDNEYCVDSGIRTWVTVGNDELNKFIKDVENINDKANGRFYIHAYLPEEESEYNEISLRVVWPFENWIKLEDSAV